MDTANPGSVSRGMRARATLRAFLPLCLALLVSGLLLSLWLTAVSARIPDQPLGAPVDSPDNNPALSNRPLTSQKIYSSPRLAPPAAILWDLEITKSRVPQTFTVGTNNRYIINVTRKTTDTITSTVIVEDILPTGMTWTPPTTAGKWDCTTSTTTRVNCFYNDAIPSGLTFEPINISVNVASTIADVVTNTARLINGGSNPANDQDTEVTPIRSADLVIDKTQLPAVVTSTDTLIYYTIVITNNGPSAANNVIITETLPAELQPYTTTNYSPPTNPTAGTFDFTTNTWSIANLAKGARETLVLITRPLPTAKGSTITNQARIRSDTHDWNLSNNLDSTTFVVGGLDIQKGVSKASALAGEIFTFAITVTNSSNNSINASVKDVLSSTLDVVSCDLFRYTGTIQSFHSQCFFSSRTLNSFITIPKSQFALFIVGVRGNKDIGETPKTVKNKATVTWGSPSFTLTSNEVAIEIGPSGFLQIGKSDGLDTVYKNQSISYTISLTNTGSIPVILNRITDTFVSNVSYVSINKNGLTMNEETSSGNVRIWSFPSKSLNPGEKITFLIGGKTASSFTSDFAINQAYASGTDNNGRELFRNNGASIAQDSDTLQTTSSTELRFTKSVSPQQAQVGETFTFNITVQNRGTVTLNNVRMSDVFPNQVDLTSATTSRGTAQLSTSTREVQITIPTLAAGDGATIVILVKVNTSVATPKTLRNRGELNWNGGVTTLSNVVAYRVLPSGSLPGTGLEYVAPQASWTSAPSSIMTVVGVALALLGLLLLVYSLWARQRRPLYAGRYARNAILILVAATVIGLGAWLTRPGSIGSGELTGLSGQKPPLATLLEIPASPTATSHNLEPSVEAPTPEPPTEPSGQISELRPTQDPLIPTETAQPTPTLSPGEVDVSFLLPTATPVDLPNFDIPSPTLIPSTGPDGGSPDSSAVTRLIIPKMGLDTVVKYVPFSGSTWLISGLKQEIAWMGDTSWPGLGGNTGLAGHVDLVTGAKGPFWNLKELKAGDQVTVYTEKNIYIYNVREQTVVDDYDLSVIQPTDKPQITLITCTSWDAELRMYLNRLVVYADLANVRPLTSSSN